MYELILICRINGTGGENVNSNLGHVNGNLGPVNGNLGALKKQQFAVIISKLLFLAKNSNMHFFFYKVSNML